MGDKAPRITNIPLVVTPSRASPASKTRKKVPVAAVRTRAVKDPPAPPAPKAAGQRKRQTPAQRRASLTNLAKARAARK